MIFRAYPCVRMASGAMLVLLAAGIIAPAALAQAKRKNPSSKVYVSDVSGEAVINTGEVMAELSKRSVYTVEGTIIETKKPDAAAADEKVFSTMVYSNGTAAYFDVDTRVEVKRFVQEPFTPHRTDMDVEPSISQTQAFVARGTVGLCTSKLVAGSSMNYQTPHGDVNIRGRKVVIQAESDVTRISMLEGESTVRAGPSDTGGHTLRAGEQAIIRAGAVGRPAQIQIVRIPPAEVSMLEEKVTLACQAKRTVYFEVRERVIDGAPGDTAAAIETESSSGDASSAASPVVTAFYGDSSTTAPGAASPSRIVREIVPVPVVPATLPVQYTVSPATLNTTTGSPGG